MSIYGTDRYASVNMLKRTEQNLSVCSDKSEGKILLTEDCSRRTVLLKLTTDSHKASRGLTAGSRTTCSQDPD